MQTEIRKIAKLILAGLFLVLLSGAQGCLFGCPKKEVGGVYRSTDGGENWESKVTIDKKNSIASVHVKTITVNPKNDSIIFIGTAGKGILKTIDKGETWQKTSLDSGTIYSLSFDLKNTNTVYAAGYVGNKGRIYRTDDGGVTWEELYVETHEEVSVYALAVDWYDNENIIAGNGEGAVFTSSDQGKSWVIQTQLNKEAVKQIILSPKDSRHVYLITESNIYKSVNRGKDWQNLNLQESMGKKFKGKIQSLALDYLLDNQLYITTTEGLLFSNDGGKSWQVVEILSQPQENSVLFLAINPQNSNQIYLGFDSTLYKSADKGKSWIVKQLSGIIQTITIDPVNPAIIYLGM